MDAQQQIAIEADAQQDLIDRVYALFDQNVLTIVALAAVGSIVAIGTVQGLRLWLGSVDDADKATREARALLLKRAGFVTGAVWTFLIVLGYITASNLIAKIVVALGVAVVAGAATPYTFDVLRWAGGTLAPAIGNWLLGKLKLMFGPKDPPAAP